MSHGHTRLPCVCVCARARVCNTPRLDHTQGTLSLLSFAVPFPSPPDFSLVLHLSRSASSALPPPQPHPSPAREAEPEPPALSPLQPHTPSFPFSFVLPPLSLALPPPLSPALNPYFPLLPLPLPPIPPSLPARPLSQATPLSRARGPPTSPSASSARAWSPPTLHPRYTPVTRRYSLLSPAVSSLLPPSLCASVKP